MMRPVRLQLSRQRGFNFQAQSRAINGESAIIVTRPGKWGNPFRIGVNRCHGTGFDYAEEKVGDAETASRFFSDMLSHADRAYPCDEKIGHELRSRNLACWCRLCPKHKTTGKPFDERCPDCAPCHADVLGARANAITCEGVN